MREERVSNDSVFIDGDDRQPRLGGQRFPEICDLGNGVLGFRSKSLALNVGRRSVLIRRLLANPHGWTVEQHAGTVDLVSSGASPTINQLRTACPEVVVLQDNGFLPS